jgi:pimeloyl-[acyl-carrier protein] methyl ester esterase
VPLDTLVLLPGLDGTGALFADLISALPPTLKVKIARYPTDCFLPYSDLAARVSEMLPTSNRFLLIAESFSTPLAAKVAATQPHNLAGLVMSAGFVTNPLRRCRRLATALARPRLFLFSPPRFVLGYFLIGSDPPKGLADGVRQTLRLVNPQVLSERVQAVLNCDAREDLSRVQVPLMYIQAEADRLVRAECFSEIQRLRPGARFVSVRAPHLLFQTEPQKASELIMGFVRQLECGSPDPA